MQRESQVYGPPRAAGGDVDAEAELVDRVMRGDEQALASLFEKYRPRLWRLVNFRLHPKLQGRVDPDDVLQEAWLRAVDRKERFYPEAARSCFLWFRTLLSQTLIDLHRRHLGAQKRSARREASIDRGGGLSSTSHLLAFHLAGDLTSPSKAAERAEMSERLESALESMNEIDREVLALRHFEELSNAETAQVLDMTEQAASARYVRALCRLKRILEAFPGFAGEPPKTNNLRERPIC